MTKAEVKLRLICWMLLLQEFDLKVIDRKEMENKVADHLSRLEGLSVEKLIIKNLKEHFLKNGCSIHNEVPWYADIANYLVGGVVHEWYSIHQRRMLISEA